MRPDRYGRTEPGDPAVIDRPPEKAKIQAPVPETPRMYRVQLINDPGLEGGIVGEALVRHFRLERAHAYRIMLTAHGRGNATVGIYTKEIAETRSRMAHDWSRTEMERVFGVPRGITFEVLPEGPEEGR